MCSTLDIRNEVNNYKKEYKETANKLLLLYLAIYKGMYIALGGKKGIALSSKMDRAVEYATIIFKYKIKLDRGKNQDVAVNYLMRNMRENFKHPAYYIKGNIPKENEEIADLLANIVLSEYTEDLVMNHKNISNIASQALEKI